MARKKKHEEHANHERWLVSYADFITLLFAFFVVMFAVSQVDSKKVGRFSESFAKATGMEILPENGKTLMPGEGDVPSAPVGGGVGEGMMSEEMKNLKSALEKAQGEGADAGPSTPDAGGNTAGIQVIARRHELVIRLSDQVLFGSGDDAVTDSSRKVIRQIAAELATRRVEVRVEGHTDDRPLRGNGRFRNNWDLSTARATSVLAELAAGGVAYERLSASGYGEFRPIAPNAGEEGRKQNRRVDLVVTTSAPPPKEPSK